MREHVNERRFQRKAGKESRTVPATPAFGVETECSPRAENMKRKETYKEMEQNFKYSLLSRGLKCYLRFFFTTCKFFWP